MDNPLAYVDPRGLVGQDRGVYADNLRLIYTLR